jgi:hypothetical protein
MQEIDWFPGRAMVIARLFPRLGKSCQGNGHNHGYETGNINISSGIPQKTGILQFSYR